MGYGQAYDADGNPVKPASGGYGADGFPNQGPARAASQRHAKMVNESGPADSGAAARFFERLGLPTTPEALDAARQEYAQRYGSENPTFIDRVATDALNTPIDLARQTMGMVTGPFQAAAQYPVDMYMGNNAGAAGDATNVLLSLLAARGAVGLKGSPASVADFGQMNTPAGLRAPAPKGNPVYEPVPSTGITAAVGKWLLKKAGLSGLTELADTVGMKPKPVPGAWDMGEGPYGPPKPATSKLYPASDSTDITRGASLGGPVGSPKPQPSMPLRGVDAVTPMEVPLESITALPDAPTVHPFQGTLGEAGGMTPFDPWFQQDINAQLQRAAIERASQSSTPQVYGGPAPDAGGAAFGDAPSQRPGQTRLGAQGKAIRKTPVKVSAQPKGQTIESPIETSPSAAIKGTKFKPNQTGLSPEVLDMIMSQGDEGSGGAAMRFSRDAYYDLPPEATMPDVKAAGAPWEKLGLPTSQGGFGRGSKAGTAPPISPADAQRLYQIMTRK